MLNQIYWLVLGLVLGGMLVGAFFSGRGSLRRQIAGEIPVLNKRELRSASARARSGWWASWLQGASTEMVGAVVTIVLLGTVVGAVQQQQLIAQQKQELISQLGSPDNAFTIEATRILRAKGWGFGEDTTLRGVYLSGANLQGASLWHANLQEANLGGANLHGANLTGANLQGASLAKAGLQEVSLIGTDLQGAYLWAANLQEANLIGTNLEEANLVASNLQGANLYRASLQGASLDGTDLQGAYLAYADLQGAYLIGANLQEVLLDRAGFDEETYLPDGSQWTPDTDMGRFTDPDHPNFWRSENKYSPAYRGDN